VIFFLKKKKILSGGVTTVIDMPLNSIPPTTTVNNLQEKIKAAKGKCWVDIGFFGGVIPGNQVCPNFYNIFFVLFIYLFILKKLFFIG
jgi:dihydroorotase-like cyclic amidohydrolase